MWPFGSSEEEDTSKVGDKLPQDLKAFFEDENSKLSDSDEVARKNLQKVNAVLARIEKRSKGSYSQEFASYKENENRKLAISTNCADIQQQIVDCLRNWSMFSGDDCSHIIKKHTSCVEIQNDAFKKLYYDECHSIEHCKSIRYIVDKLFVKNFGEFGDNVSADSKDKFNRDIQSVFDKVWK